jgi:methylmalonyl-CoA epimerase
MKNHIDHLGIVVKSLDESLRFYTDILGLEVTRTETVDGEDVKIALLPGGGINIELIEPRGPDSHAGRFLKTHGEGLHHISYQVPNIVEACRRCSENGIRILNEEPLNGANGRRYIFLDPKTTNHVLVELCQVPEDSIFSDKIASTEIIDVIKNGIERIDLEEEPSE